MTLASVLGSPMLRYGLRLGTFGLVAGALIYGGVRWERMRGAIALAQARAESAQRETALAVEAERGRAAVAAAEAAAATSKKASGEAIARAETESKRADAAGVRLAQATRARAALPPDASCETKLDVITRQADDAVAAFEEMRVDRDAWRVAARSLQSALDDQTGVSAKLAAQGEAKDAQLAELRMDRERGRVEEFKLAGRSHRRATEIAGALAAGLVAGMVLSR